jgi:hypothetical protein
MIVGAHSILYSKNAAADRAFLKDVLGFPSVDVGDGWLIFGLPPSEVAVHPSEKNDVHEFYLMTDDVEKLVADLTRRRIKCGPVQNQGWGLLTQVTLPGGGKLGIYQPRHARPKAVDARKKTARAASKTAAKTKTLAKTKTRTKTKPRPRG